MHLIQLKNSSYIPDQKYASRRYTERCSNSRAGPESAGGPSQHPSAWNQ